MWGFCYYKIMTSTSTVQLPNIETCNYTNPMYKPSALLPFQNLAITSTGYLPTHSWQYASSTCRSTSTVLIYNSLDNTYSTTSKVTVTNFASSTATTSVIVNTATDNSTSSSLYQNAQNQTYITVLIAGMIFALFIKKMYNNKNDRNIYN